MSDRLRRTPTDEKVFFSPIMKCLKLQILVVAEVSSGKINITDCDDC